MNLKASFSWFGLVIFALPMLINIAYVMFPPVGKAEQTVTVTHWIEIVEQISRIAYLFAVTLLVSPMPLAVFPVLYYLCAAIWMHNLPAAVIMVMFGAAHLTVSVQSFR